MMYLRLLYVLLGISKILTAEPLSPSQSTFKIVYRIRIYQRVGRSREEWREMIPPDVRDTPSTETKERCAAGLVSPSDENKTKAEQLGVQNKSVASIYRNAGYSITPFGSARDGKPRSFLL